MEKLVEVICAGELLIDFIGKNIGENLLTTTDFTRFQGGSPSNFGANLAKIGHSVAIVSTVGNDNLGQFLIDTVKETGLDTTHIRKDSIHPTSLVIVSRTLGTPDFIAYRQADCQILPSQLPENLLQNAKIFHTCCFAISRFPARETILVATKLEKNKEIIFSIDLNYAPSIWPDRNEALHIIREYVSCGALVKLSLDDAERLFAKEESESFIVNYWLEKGARLVCLTKGKEGCIVATHQEITHYPAPQIEVTGDATGAGDAFWAGFVSGFLKKMNIAACVNRGQKLAALKLQTVGPLPTHFDFD